MNKGALGIHGAVVGKGLVWKTVGLSEFLSNWSFDADDTTRPAYAVWNDLVFMRGVARFTSGSYSFPTQILKLPTHARPLFQQVTIYAPLRDPLNNANSLGVLTIGTDGIITQTSTALSISGIGGNTNSLQYLYGIVFPRKY
jgi:hypothetical protein